MKKIILLLLLLYLPVQLQAQLGEPRRILSVGASAGVNFNSIGFSPTIKQNKHIGPTAGVAFRVTSEKYFKLLCALQIELNYAQLGWNENIIDSNSQPLPDSYKRHINYVQMPILARLAYGKEDRGLAGYLVIGPQIGYAFSESETRSAEWTVNGEGNPDRPNDMFAQYSMDLERPFDYGITAGLGLEFNANRGHYSVEVRYYYGLGNIFSNRKKDVFERSNHNTLSARLTYFFDIKKK
ncbi:MAG: PorT family protein [Alloprevotella sp.]|nr:PorT family protein [Alloprevotella sp.]